jgi:aminopeptidase N
LVGFNGSLYEGTNPAPGELLELTVAHEVAHQWWYGLVGNNQYAHAFLDEGLASLSEVIYLERVHGAAAAQARLDSLDNSDLVVDQPTDWFPAGDVAYDTIYGKGALGFQSLRLEIGDAAFFAGLRDYVARERFAVAAPADLRAALEQASGGDLTATWQLWFDSPGMPPRPGLAVAGRTPFVV